MPASIIVVANQKGGVGKTTTAINLGTALAAIDERVPIVDLDPQGNASTGLGIDYKNRERSTYDALTGGATPGSSARRPSRIRPALGGLPVRSNASARTILPFALSAALLLAMSTMSAWRGML